jgi:hypothetical protein
VKRSQLLALALCASAAPLLFAACSASDPSTTPAVDASTALPDATPTADGGATLPDGTPEAAVDASADAPADAPFDAAPLACQTNEAWNVPPIGLPGWSPVLSQTGALTLGGHGHDDGNGPLGFCSANVAPGTRYLALVSARFETDQQDQSFPSMSACVVDYLASDPTFQKYGMCFSGGNHNVYVEVRDESGKRLATGMQIFYGGMTTNVSDQGKPPNEFPMNYPIYGGGSKYGVRAVYMHPQDGPLRSDAVTNLRMPVNHHVNYLLTFQVKKK